MLPMIYFVLLGLIAAGSAVCVFLSKNPLYGALSLVVTMVSLAGIYGLLASPFVGVVQVMVYAGAIMMLLTFVIMILNAARDVVTPRFDRVSIFVLPAILVLAGLLAFVLISTPLQFHAEAVRGSVALTSATLFDMSKEGPGYFILFEAIGLLLLSAMATAVLLAKKRLGTPERETVSKEVH
ncbi:MAG: NADH-quinone oxidoreductase subunit J [Fibrobacter sp.]|jgi:NADH-quinone oxidoreductase subunit J|nr:NADH-quinone oxidoreductase subunit J [Fibrobacter sp.]